MEYEVEFMRECNRNNSVEHVYFEGDSLNRSFYSKHEFDK